MEQYKFNVPTKWEDITLDLFQQIKRLYKEYEGKTPPAYKLVALLSGQNEQTIKETPALVVDEVMEAMTFINTPVTNDVSNKITIEDTTYIINLEEDLSFGEFVDCNTVLEADESNLAAILAIVCRKEEEIYNDDFIAKKLDKRIKMFEQQPMTKIQPLINAFLNSSAIYATTIRLFSEKLKANTMTFLAAIETSHKNGAGKGFRSLWRMMKLKKLRKSLECI